MSEFETRLQNRAVKTVTQQKDNMPPDLFREMLSAVLDKIASGDYAFGGMLCQKALGSLNGVADLVSILCDVTPDEALSLLAEEGAAFQVVFDDVIKKSISSPDDEDTGDEKKS